MTDHPVLLSAPSLPLQEFIDVGPWRVGPLDAYDGPWLSDGFEHVSRTFLKSFRLANGDALPNPAIIVRSNSGADGSLPPEAEQRALALAVGFATVDANPPWEPDLTDNWKAATSDNSDIWVQPIDTEHRRISVERGGRVKVLAGGYRLEGDFTIQAPIEIHIPFGVSLDDELATAVWDLAVSPPTGLARPAQQILVAINWLLKAWRNTPSVSWEDRVVLTKTAFEALLDQSKTPEAMKLLRDVFETAQQYLRDTLWTPGEATLQRRTRSGPVDVTLVEHWYGAFADARNAIIHDGATGMPVLWYEHPTSPYHGSLPDIADRVLREAIKARMATMGFERVCMTKSFRMILDGLIARGIQSGQNLIEMHTDTSAEPGAAGLATDDPEEAP